MRRLGSLAKRLGAAVSRTGSYSDHQWSSQIAAACSHPSRTTATAAAVVGLASAASVQWGLAEAPTQDAPSQQQQQDDGSNCPDCSNTKLEEQPVAVSNSATAQWRVFTDMGRELLQQGRNVEAERYFKKAVEMAQAGFGPEDPHLASACNNLAEYYRLQRRYDEAEPLYRQALQILTKAYSLRDARVAFALHNLGGFHLSRRQLAQAADCYEQALRIKLEVLGTRHSETSNTMYHLGEVRWQQGQRHQAVTLVQQSLEIMEAQGVGATPGCVRRRGRLAEMLLEAGRAQEAEKLLRGVLEYVESAQGLEHANLAAAAENLATALQQQGRWEEARGLMHRALEVRSTHAGARHPVVAVTLRKLAELELAATTAAAAEEVDGSPAATVKKEAGRQASPGGAAGSPAGTPAAVGAGSSKHGQQQAVEIAQEALSIAQQAYRESLDWQRRRGEPKEGSGGLLAWLGLSKPELSTLRRPQRPDSAALEVAQCLLILSRAHAAVHEIAAAAADLEQALQVLAEAFPHASGGSNGGSSSAKGQQQKQQQQQQPQELSAPGADGDTGGGTDAIEGGAVEEQELASSGTSRPSAASTVGARELARAVRVGKARHELACRLLAELLVLAQRAATAGGVGAPHPTEVQRQLAQEGCGD